MVRAELAGGWRRSSLPYPCLRAARVSHSSAKSDSAAQRVLSSSLGPTQAGTWAPGPSQGRSPMVEVDGCSLCLLLSSALQLAFTCGNIQAPWITFYHSDSNWSSRKFWGRTGSQMLLLPPLAKAAISLLGEMSADGPTPGFRTWALWVFGRRSSLRHTTNRASRCDLIAKRNVTQSTANCYITVLQCHSSLIRNVSSFFLTSSSHTSENKYPYLWLVWAFLVKHLKSSLLSFTETGHFL